VSTVTVIGCVQADLLMSPVTELPPSGGTLLTEQMSLRVGGAGANAALAFVELGMPVRLMGCVGDDQLGRWMQEQMDAAGLADSLVVSPEPSGLTVALESPNRDRTFLTYLGVNARWKPGMIPADALACDNLLFCDYFVAPGLQGPGGRELLEGARATGARTFFDTAWDPGGFSPQTRDEVYGLLPSVDVFLPNEAEACALAGFESSGPGVAGGGGAAGAAARVLQAVSGGCVVVKLGPRGCLAVGPDGIELAAPAPVLSGVADTTGAGDAFNAGLVHALSDGASWPDALHAATRFASMIIARPSHERHRLGPAQEARFR
jgi:sugar/nucleoside kinase (ribokinase family)